MMSYCIMRQAKLSCSMQPKIPTMPFSAYAGLLPEEGARHQGDKALPVTLSIYLPFICDFAGHVLRFSKKGTSLCIDLSRAVRLPMP